VALAQRALADAYTFASERVVFGKRLIDQPLMNNQFRQHEINVRNAFALAWKAAQLANVVSREVPGVYSDTYKLYRLVTHLAKFRTAEVAVETARWAMEVHGGAGTLREQGVERWLREAMILTIWEGPPQRQVLDGFEAMQRKGAHHLLLTHLGDGDPDQVAALRERLESHLGLPPDEREASAEPMFRDLAQVTGHILALRLETTRAALEHL
jgi:acyl-CoA dehydrogenase